MVFQNRRYWFAFLLGVVGGGLVVAIVTDALPKMMSQMMAQMGGEAGDAAEMWRRMMAGFGKAQAKE